MTTTTTAGEESSRKCVFLCVLFKWQAFLVWNSKFFEPWWMTNVNKCEQMWWWLASFFSHSLLLPHSNCVRVCIRMTNHHMSKSVRSIFLVTFQQIKSIYVCMMIYLTPFDTHMCTYLITVCKNLYFFFTNNNSWNSNPTLLSKQNSHHKRDLLLFFYFCFTDINNVISQCISNVISLWINNNFICIILSCSCLLSFSSNSSHLSLFCCSAHKMIWEFSASNYKNIYDIIAV